MNPYVRERRLIWVRRTAVVAVGWGGLVAYAELTNRPYSLFGLLPVALAVGAVWWFVADTGGTIQQPDWRPFRHHAAMRTFDPRFTRLRQDVAEVGARPAAAVDIRRSLRSVSDGLLRDRFGVDPDQDPEARPRILGPDVVAFLDGAGPEPREGDPTHLPRLFAVLDTLETL